MDYERLERELIMQIIKNDKNCMNTIEYNKDAIRFYFNDYGYVNKFVLWLNNVIADELEEFSLVESILYHELFFNVLQCFRRSLVLIEAIKKKNKKACDWLLKMNIDPYIQDEKGMTALMHAAENNLYDVVSVLAETNKDLLNIKDYAGNTVVFYSLNTVFMYFYQNVPDMLYNELNNLNDDILISSCKIKSYTLLEKVLSKTKDIMLENKEGKTAVMYLVEQGKYDELVLIMTKIEETLKNNKSFTFTDYINKYNDQIINILMNQFKRVYGSLIVDEVKNYCKILRLLCHHNFNFNVIIDEEGNTPLIFFLMVHDYYSSYYIMKFSKNIDFTIKNKNGISPTYLSLLVPKDDNVTMSFLLYYDDFDYNYTEPLKNNILMLFVYHGFTQYLLKVITRNRDLLNQVNNKFENIVIMSTKLRALSSLVITSENINQQDIFGNTALYYAINLRDKEEINLLVYKKADQNIKNNQGISPLDLAKQINDKDILDILRKPIDPMKMSKKVKKENKKADMTKTNVSYEKEYQFLHDQLHTLKYKPLPINRMNRNNQDFVKTDIEFQISNSYDRFTPYIRRKE